MKHKELLSKILGILTNVSEVKRNSCILYLAYMSNVPVNLIDVVSGNSIFTLFSFLEQAELTNNLDNVSDVVDKITSHSIDK
jgi:deoxyhypusine synthase